MKRLLLILLFVCSNAWAAGLADIKFGRYQIADSQWNVSACMYTNTCQIYATNPGTMYKIPWYNGQWAWQAGQYVQFVLTGNTANPYEGKIYNSNGTLAGSIGTGHIINMGVDSAGHALFFFVGNDNDTGQLFSANYGLSGTSGYTWTGTLNPTTTQVDSFAASYGTTTPLSAGQTYTAAPSLCCGGSAAQFNADQTNVNKITGFVNRTTNNSAVYIEQIGNNNEIVVDQSGTKNNSATYIGNGSSNTVNITQTGNNSTIANYTELRVTGNNNTVDLTQTSTGGGKGTFVNITDNNNSVTVLQKDSGSDYLNLNLSGGNKTVDITQQGSANHMADITLSGTGARSLTLTQQGSTQQFYSINSSCASSCQAITVIQGN